MWIEIDFNEINRIDSTKDIGKVIKYWDHPDFYNVFVLGSGLRLFDLMFHKEQDHNISTILWIL